MAQEHVVDLPEALVPPAGEIFSLVKPGQGWAYEVVAGDTIVLRHAQQELARAVVTSCRWASAGTLANPAIYRVHLAAKGKGDDALRHVLAHIQAANPDLSDAEHFSFIEMQMA